MEKIIIKPKKNLIKKTTQEILSKKKRFISFSGGVESSTMCVLFGGKADAIFADTGFEHQVIYDRIDLVEKWVQEFHRKDFKIHFVKNKELGTLPDYIKQIRFYPSIKKRYCTYLFKIKPIDDFLRQFKTEGAEIMIGLNADEIEMRTGAHGLLPFVSYSYPLAENGLSRSACIRILDHAGLKPDFPPYMKRGGCIGCYYKSKMEYFAMAALNPKEFKIVEDLENDLNALFSSRKRFFSILKGKRMSAIRQEANSLIFDPKDIYPIINDATKCGVFCNR